MSYDIYIGDAVRCTCPPEDECHQSWHVEGITLPDAPAFEGDKMTGQSNGRHPGYAQWHEFCRAHGLEALFFDPHTGLMRQHPGCAFLTPDHLAAVEAAVKRYQTRHPGAVPGLATGHYDLVRLLWLEWWMRKALDTCEVPALANY